MAAFLLLPAPVTGLLGLKDLCVDADHGGDDEADEETEDGCRADHHKGLVHEDALALILREADRAQHAVLPDRFLHVRCRRDHQQEEGDEESNDGDDRDKDLEHEAHLVHSLLQEAVLHDNDVTVGQNALDAANDLCFLVCSDAIFELHKALLLRDIVREAIASSLVVEAFASFRRPGPCLLNHGLVGVSCNEYRNPIQGLVDEQGRLVVSEEHTRHLARGSTHDHAAREVVLDCLHDLDQVTSLNSEVGSDRTRDDDWERVVSAHLSVIGCSGTRPKCNIVGIFVVTRVCLWVKRPIFGRVQHLDRVEVARVERRDARNILLVLCNVVACIDDLEEVFRDSMNCNVKDRADLAGAHKHSLISVVATQLQSLI